MFKVQIATSGEMQEDLAFISPESEATISTYLPLSPKELQATSDELGVTSDK